MLALDPFNHAVSFVITCADQAEIDRLWKALSDGGPIEQCGWLKERYGVSWHIVPAMLAEMMKDLDRARAKRVAEASSAWSSSTLQACRRRTTPAKPATRAAAGTF